MGNISAVKTDSFLLPPNGFNSRRPLSNTGDRKNRVSERGENLNVCMKNVSSEVEKKTVALIHQPTKKSSMPDVDC